MPIFKKKLHLLYGLFFVLFLGPLLFSSPLIRFGINSSLLKNEAYSLSYKKMRWRGGKLILQEVTLERRGDLRGPATRVDELWIAFNPSLFPLGISPAITLRNPHIFLADSEGEGDLLPFLTEHFLQKPIAVENGDLHFEKESSPPLYFTLKSGERDGKSAATCRIFDRERRSVCTVELSKKNGGIGLDLAFRAADLRWLYEIGRLFLPQWSSAFEVKGGQITGSLRVDCETNRRVDALACDLDVKNLAIAQREPGLLLCADHLTYKRERGTEKTAFPPSFIERGKLSRGTLTLGDVQVGSIEGALHANEREPAFFTLYGTFKEGNEEAYFSCSGKGVDTPHREWEIDCAAIPEGGEKMSVRLAIAPGKDGLTPFHLQFEEVHADQINFAKRFLPPFFPQIRTCEITSGLFAGEVTGRIQGGKLQEIEINRFYGKQSGFAIPSQQLAFKTASVYGQGSIDLQNADPIDGISWRCTLSGGKIEIDGKEVADEIAADCAMSGRSIHPSTLSGRLQEREGELRWSGVYGDVDVECDYSFVPHMLSSPCGSLGTFDELSIGTKMRGRARADSFDLEGTLRIFQEGMQGDAIAFGVDLETDFLQKGGWKHPNRALQKGWFQASDLSSRTVNLLLWLFGKNWWGEGKLDIEGTFTRQEIELTIDPRDFTYFSPYMAIRPTPFSQREGKACALHYDFAKECLSGSLPLKGVVLEERLLGITFDSFTSQVDLTEGETRFKNFEATSSGVCFLGEMRIDHRSTTHTDLQIATSYIEGSALDVQSFIRHFSPPFHSPFLQGGTFASYPGEMDLQLRILGKEIELLSSDVTLHLCDGECAITPHFTLKNARGKLAYTSSGKGVEFANVEGDILLHSSASPKSYRLDIPSLSIDWELGRGEYDLRLETTTHDVFRVKGGMHIEEGEIAFDFDPDQTYCWGMRGKGLQLALKMDGEIASFAYHSSISAFNLYQLVNFLHDANLFPLDFTSLIEDQISQFEGEVHFSCLYDGNLKRGVFRANSDHFSFGQFGCDRLHIEGTRRGKGFYLDRFEFGDLSICAALEKNAKGWEMPLIDIDWMGSALKVRGATYQNAERKWLFPIESCNLFLNPLIERIPLFQDEGWGCLTGRFSLAGFCELDLSKGGGDWTTDTTCKLIGEEVGKGKLHLESTRSLHLSLTSRGEVLVKNGDLYLLHPRLKELWMGCRWDALVFDGTDWQGKNCELTISPEMGQFLLETDVLPPFEVQKENLSLLKTPFIWKNQIEMAFDFFTGKETAITGHLKEGYYWIENEGWYLDKCTFTYREGGLDFLVRTLYKEIPFHFDIHLSLFPHFTSTITIREFSGQRGENYLDPLMIFTDWNAKKGVFIQKIQGEICGLAFSLYHNPKESSIERAVLTGHIKIDGSALSSLFPSKFQKFAQRFGIGKGYKLSGDLTLLKGGFRECYFDGYLKGKHFELMRSNMETLLGKVTIRPSRIELKNLKICDPGGMLFTREIHIEKFHNQKWHLTIPELILQNFSPSSLQKSDGSRRKRHPFVIRDLHFFDMRGTLGEKSTFTGKGHFSFNNTSAKEHQIANFPGEIIGQLGLEHTLFIPTQGKIECVLVGERIYLIDLTDSYSQGNRSQFFLLPTLPSYIDFEGNLNLNIRIKQHILLKIAEPFIFSIEGTLAQPKYGLR